MSAGVLIAIVIILAIIVVGVSFWIHRLSHREPGVLRKCPYCDAIVPRGEAFCPNCGKQLQETTISL